MRNTIGVFIQRRGVIRVRDKVKVRDRIRVRDKIKDRVRLGTLSGLVLSLRLGLHYG